MQPSPFRRIWMETPVLVVVAVAFFGPAASAQERPFFKQMRAQPHKTIAPSTREAELPADGTWREEGQDLILNIDGRVLRLRKSSSTTTETTATEAAPDSEPSASSDALRLNRSRQDRSRQDHSIEPAAFFADHATPASPSGGTVVGRLTNRGRPLVHCEVSLTPLRRNVFGYGADQQHGLPLTITDAAGDYRFENLPAGHYKLRWRPQGEEAWIRRIEYRPDVTVKTGKTARIREIRTALRTLN